MGTLSRLSAGTGLAPIAGSSSSSSSSSFSPPPPSLNGLTFKWEFGNGGLSCLWGCGQVVDINERSGKLSTSRVHETFE